VPNGLAVQPVIKPRRPLRRTVPRRRPISSRPPSRPAIRAAGSRWP